MNLFILNILQSRGNSPTPPTFEWNDMPEAAFTPTTTLTYSGSGGVNSAAISGHTDIGLDGVWNRMRADGLVGSEGTPIRFVNIDAATQIGNRLHADWENWICIDSINGSSTPKLGHAYSAGSGHWTGTMGLFCQKSTELSGGEITNMWSYGGF